MLCSGNPGGRDEWSPALLHLPVLRPGPGGAGRGRTDGLRALEGKQAQTLLLIAEQCFSGRVFVRVQHDNTKTVALLELSDGFGAGAKKTGGSTGEEIIHESAVNLFRCLFFVCTLREIDMIKLLFVEFF